MTFGELMNALAEPDVRYLSGGGDQLPEFRSNLDENTPPIADLGHPERVEGGILEVPPASP